MQTTHQSKLPNLSVSQVRISIMEISKLFNLTPIFLSTLFVSLLCFQGEGLGWSYGGGSGGDYKLRRLFVFGDSYADTGNIRKSIAYSWKFPYGVTFPGKATGRFSDGRVLTDYVAKFMRVKSPFPYTWREVAPGKTKHGVNFAFGGTGVFDTLVPLPNMTAQIDLFQQMLYGNDVVPIQQRHLNDSVALVSCVGNDYSTFLTLGGSFQELPKYITKVVNQVELNLRRIHALGMKKIMVTALQPIGCLPGMSNWFKQCNATENSAVALHNLLLQRTVAKLNKEAGSDETPIIVLDLFNSFMLALQQKQTYPGSVKFEEPLKPCCMGVDENSSCSDVDANGTKLYTVCDDPKASFFWDTFHPTQAGWEAVYGALQANLQQLFY